jgi:hypothetical protein
LKARKSFKRDLQPAQKRGSGRNPPKQHSPLHESSPGDGGDTRWNDKLWSNIREWDSANTVLAEVNVDLGMDDNLRTKACLGQEVWSCVRSIKG